MKKIGWVNGSDCMIEEEEHEGMQDGMEEDLLEERDRARNRGRGAGLE